MRSTSGWIVGVHTIDEPGDRKLPSQKHDADEERYNQTYTHCHADRGTFHSILSCVPLLNFWPPDRCDSGKEKYFRNEADDSTARSCHHQSDTHQPGHKQVKQALLFFDSSTKQQTERQRDRQLHIAGEVMPIDERSESGALG